jgi:hypothetical protein
LKEQFLTPFLSRIIGSIIFFNDNVKIELISKEIEISLKDIKVMTIYYNNYRHWKGFRKPYRIPGDLNLIKINTDKNQYNYTFLCEKFEDKNIILRLVNLLNQKGHKITYSDRSK